MFHIFSIDYLFSWSDCSRDCGTGFKTRSRSCSENERCSGLSEEAAECNTDICPKDKDNDKEIDGATYSVCKLWGDPHVKRFDGTFIDLLDAGNYTMVESRYISDSEIKTRYTMSITTDSTFRTTESEKYLYIFF